VATGKKIGLSFAHGMRQIPSMPEDATPLIAVFGAEQQAATSLALAYPKRRFLFLSDGRVVDGWDLPNVRIKTASAPAGGEASEGVPLSARWLANPAVTALTVCWPRIEGALPGIPIPVAPAPEPLGRSIVKGDLWHRPDVPLVGTAQELADLADPHGCGVVYQALIPAQGSVMAIGRRLAEGRVSLGLFRVLNERFFRVDVLQAAESIEMPALRELSLAVLSALAYEGWFTLNWLLTAEGPRLSSFRPVPKAAFGCFRRAGIDLLRPEKSDAFLAAGLRLIAVPHYASFEWTPR
jgi:hypothetical protein